MTELERQISIMEAAGHDWVPVPISTLKGLMMATKTVGRMKVVEKDGKVKLTHVRKFDASKTRRIAKSKTKRATSPAKARAAR